jgi:hypothetical protein
MFESSLLRVLQANTDITALLSTYQGRPSIFSEFAPQDAELPYLIFRIGTIATMDVSIQRFNIVIDIYDKKTSYKNIRSVAFQTQLFLDRARIAHSRFGKIRIYYFSDGEVDEMGLGGAREYDPRSIHWNMLFKARSGRKEWSRNQTTLEY